MRLQLEILLHPAARWGEDASLLVAAGAAALLLQDCLRGIGTLSSSGIMVRAAMAAAAAPPAVPHAAAGAAAPPLVPICMTGSSRAWA